MNNYRNIKPLEQAITMIHQKGSGVQTYLVTENEILSWLDSGCFQDKPPAFPAGLNVEDRE